MNIKKLIFIYFFLTLSSCVTSQPCTNYILRFSGDEHIACLTAEQVKQLIPQPEQVQKSILRQQEIEKK